ncbi:ABC transporter permease [Amphritea japonica]|uniref:Transport permease protein n=1 Tax=Amphritea japonica ATCC BAA-1530 TaxID=1278309 RepID=A0A7R6SRF9_9GAMM|nr:ABC transporter permease [Amphritea japonica]BBB25105.1 capsular polysaccharide transport system permease protein [Amphritea japonica ATCC BAA-1530]
MLTSRTPWQVTRAVWYALFMREAIAKITSRDRMAWFWMLFEPIAMVAVMVSIRGVVMNRGGHVSGAEFIPWIIVGLMGFYLFRENLQRSLGAIQSNKGLFAYRQVKSIDPVLVRCFLEGMIKSFIMLLFIIIGGLLGVDLVAVDPLYAFYCWFSLWCLGLGSAFTASAASEMVPEIGYVLKIIMLPLMIVSGVIFPLNFLPHWIQEFLLWNPIVHGLESLRLGFFEGYRSLLGINLAYLWYWNLSFILLGLILHLRFDQRLKAQ